MSFIPLSVAPFRFVRGIDTLMHAEGVPVGENLEVVDLHEAMRTRWPDDAHFVPYTAFDNDGTLAERIPRLNKVCLPEINSAGGRVECRVFALDWDNPRHMKWGSEGIPSIDERLEQFMDAANEFPVLGDYTCLYTTEAGCRIVYVFDRPLSPHEFEGAVRWVIGQATRAGLHVDDLYSWNHLFRLPQVLRSRHRTEEQDYFCIEIDEEAVVQTDRIGRAQVGSGYDGPPLRIETDLPEMPDDKEARGLVFKDPTECRRPTSWGLEARRRLKNREFYGPIFEGQKVARKGERNNRLTRMIGQVCAMLVPVEGTTIEHLYGLISPSLDSIEQDPGEDWRLTAWDILCRIWKQEDAKHRALKEEERQREQEIKDVEWGMVLGARTWCNDDDLHDQESEEKPREWVRRHIVALGLNSCYLMSPDGTYYTTPLAPRQIIAAIRKRLGDVVQTYKITDSGVTDKTSQEIFNSHGTIVSREVALPSRTKATIDNPDTDDATLYVPCFRRNEDLEPVYSADVHQWLEAMFGDDLDDACRWIAWALAFEEGDICAMSISGAPGTGKKMLVQGLAECLRSPCTATDVDITGEFRYNLLRTPFIVVNEGWGARKGGKAEADAFRELVSGDPTYVNRKHLPPIQFYPSPRVIFTANNLDVIRRLADEKDLTQDDRDALSVRLLHFNVGSRGADYLRSMGGRAHTAVPGRRWIAASGSSESDYIIARHFLWLYGQRHSWNTDGRLLVEGKGSHDLMMEMQTRVGRAPLVIETIFKMLQAVRTPDGMVFDKDNHRVFVTAHAVLSFFRETIAKKTRENLTAAQTSLILEGLSRHARSPVRHIEGHEDKGARAWFDLDLEKIKEAGSLQGLRSEFLEKEQQSATKVRS